MSLIHQINLACFAVFLVFLSFDLKERDGVGASISFSAAAMNLFAMWVQTK